MGPGSAFGAFDIHALVAGPRCPEGPAGRDVGFLCGLAGALHTLGLEPLRLHLPRKCHQEWKTGVSSETQSPSVGAPGKTGQGDAGPDSSGSLSRGPRPHPAHPLPFPTVFPSCQLPEGLLRLGGLCGAAAAGGSLTLWAPSWLYLPPDSFCLPSSTLTAIRPISSSPRLAPLAASLPAIPFPTFLQFPDHMLFLQSFLAPWERCNVLPTPSRKPSPHLIAGVLLRAQHMAVSE